MAAGDFTKFNGFITEVAAGTHVDILNTSTDTIKAFLINETPAATHLTYGGEGASAGTALGSIAHANIVETWPIDISNTTSQSAATITVDMAATVVATCDAAVTVPEFQFVVLYNDTDANDKLIGWYDNGSKVNLTAGQTFTVTFGSELFTLG